jgi:hypothetical protein
LSFLIFLIDFLFDDSIFDLIGLVSFFLIFNISNIFPLLFDFDLSSCFNEFILIPLLLKSVFNKYSKSSSSTSESSFLSFFQLFDVFNFFCSLTT